MRGLWGKKEKGVSKWSVQKERGRLLYWKRRDCKTRLRKGKGGKHARGIGEAHVLYV